MSPLRNTSICFVLATLFAPGVSGQIETRMVADLNDTELEPGGDTPQVAVMGGLAPSIVPALL